MSARLICTTSPWVRGILFRVFPPVPSSSLPVSHESDSSSTPPPPGDRTHACSVKNSLLSTVFCHTWPSYFSSLCFTLGLHNPPHEAVIRIMLIDVPLGRLLCATCLTAGALVAAVSCRRTAYAWLPAIAARAHPIHLHTGALSHMPACTHKCTCAWIVPVGSW